jgi:hypothetical protein
MSTSKEKCPRCDEYANAGHNYCRMCGNHLTKDFTQFTRIAVGYFTNEKYCGYCGKLRKNCKC